jgi:hypothetical protein
MTPTIAASVPAPLPQHMEALAKANEVRLCQAELKRRIAAGRLHLDAVLVGTADLDELEREAFDRMILTDFLCAAHRVGRTRVRTILARLAMATAPPVAIPERKRLGAMTVRQRHVLAAELRRSVPGSCSGAPL